MAPSLSVAQLPQYLTQQMPAPLYLVVGEEDLLRDAAVAAIKQAVLGGEGDAFNCDVFYGDEADGGQIVACAAESAVFAARRLVLVKSAEKLSAKQGETLLPYVKDPNDGTTLVFVAAKLDGRLKFTQALNQAAVVVDCASPRDAALGPWILQEAKRIGVTLREDAVALLKENAGGSLYALRRELEKLSAYANQTRAVTVEDVAVMRGTEPGASVFDLAEAIGARQRGRALAIAARNIEAGEAPLRILGSLAWQYRRIWKVKEVVRQGGRDGEAARTLRMDPARVKPFLGQFSEAHLQDALAQFLAADAQLKGGSSGKPAMILDRLILKLCARTGVQSQPMHQHGTPPRPRSLSNVRTITTVPRPRS